MIPRLIPVFAVAITGLMTLAACATRIPIAATMPATRIDLAQQGVKRIAVGDVVIVDQRNAATALELGEELRAGLVDLGRFEILDRSAVKGLIREQALNASGMVDGSTAVATGKFAGATALIEATVTKHQATQRQETRTVQVGENRSQTQYQRRAQATVAISFKITDLQTGKSMAVTPFTREVTHFQPHSQGSQSRLFNEPAWLKRGPEPMWSAEPVPEINLDGLLAQLRREAVTTFVRSIAPYQVTFDVELAADSDLPMLEEGNKAARIGEWAEAESQYRAGVAKMPNHAGAHFNLGIALRSQGKFDAALAELKIAYKYNDSTAYQAEIDITKQMASGAAQAQ